jgi:hypothetical protein
VFAAVCVLLASLGHVIMSGTAVPWWAMTAGAAATGGTAWLLAGRERGPIGIASLVVAVQAVLHASFALAQAVAHPGTSGGGPLVRRWPGHLLCGSPPGPGTEHGPAPAPMAPLVHHAMGVTHSMGPMDHMGTAHPTGHGMGGMSPAGMLTAHLLAALLCGLWLAQGERAAFRVLRALAGWLAAPLRLLLRLPVPPYRPGVRARRGRPDGTLHRLLLTRAVTSRGPPG